MVYNLFICLITYFVLYGRILDNCYLIFLFRRYTKIQPGEPIIIKAIKETPEAKHWTVNNNSGFIISQPDTLVSGTSVVGALFCNRRSTFQEKFRLIESLPHNNVGNNYMLTGSLTHELFQTVLIFIIFPLLH